MGEGKFSMWETLVVLKDLCNTSEKSATPLQRHLHSMQNELQSCLPDLTGPDFRLLIPFQASILPLLKIDFRKNSWTLSTTPARVTYLKENRMWGSGVEGQSLTLRLRSFLLAIHCSFLPTFLREAGFFCLFVIKSKMWSRLAVKDEVRCTLASTAPRMSWL